MVTGASGFIGSNLVDRLLASGFGVTGVDALTEYYDRGIKLRNLAPVFESDDFRFVEADLLEADLPSLLGEADAVVHLAAEPGVRTSWGKNFSRYLERNVLATQRLLEAMRPQDGQRMVFASSSSVYGSAHSGPLTEDSPRRPASPYGLTKLAAEELIQTYVRQSDLRATMLRYFTVYGPRQRPEMAMSSFISAVQEGRPVRVFGDGEQEREFTFVSDIVEATVRAIDAPEGTYNVGGGSRATVNEVIGLVERGMGKEARVRYEPYVRGDVRSTWADLTRSGEALGYAPKVGLEEGVEAQISWFLKEASRPVGPA